MTDVASKMAQWGRSILAPVIVAVVVGMATAYLTAQESLAVHEERLATHAVYLERHHDDISDLDDSEADLSRALVRIEAEVAATRAQLDRIESQIEGM